MKFRYLITVVILTFTLSPTNIAQGIKKDLNHYKLQGAVKSMKMFKFEAIDKFGQISKGNPKGYSFENIVVLFNEDGNAIEINWYKTDGKLEYKYLIGYDDWGFFKKKDRYNSNGKVNSKRVYVRDSLERTYTENKYAADGSLESIILYSYNEDWKLIRQVSQYFEDMANSGYNTYEYNDIGKIIELKGFNTENRFSSRFSFTYNELNLIKERYYYFKEGSPSKEVYFYDELGNLIEEKKYSLDGNLLLDSTFKYEMDQMGNWIRKIEFHDMIPKYIYERNLEYFSE